MIDARFKIQVISNSKQTVILHKLLAIGTKPQREHGIVSNRSQTIEERSEFDWNKNGLSIQ